MNRLHIAAAAGTLALAGAALVIAAPGKSGGDPVKRALEFYGSQPRLLQPAGYSKAPEGLPDMKASTCGACHQEIYREWRVSTHARAWLDDAQFQEELHKSRSKPGQDTGWICVNCHTPMINQLPELVVGLENGAVEKPIYVKNPTFDADMQKEAIGCATCHVRDGVVLGPYGDTKAPHPVRKDPGLLEVGVCTQCHQAKAEFRHIALACVFDTGEEYAAGPYPAEGKTCQSCHMPEVERTLGIGSERKRKTRRHWFGGSLIPKHPKFANQVKALETHYPDGMSARFVEMPTALKAGQTHRIAFEAVNDEAGHMLPSGDPERYILLRAEATDPNGKVLASQEMRFGTRYQWHPAVKKLDDTRLAPRESRRATLEVTAPQSGVVRLRLYATKWRISPENMAYHELDGRYVSHRAFIDESVEVPVQ